jgi:hypothetical protein
LAAHSQIRVLAAVLLGLTGLGMLVPPSARAQSRWTLTPSLSLSERYDDNVFSTADNRQSDFITEITPGISIALDQPTLALSAGYSITGQIYADNSTLSNFGDNQSAFLSASYQASPQFRLTANGYFARTSEIESFLRPPTVPQTVTVTTLPTVTAQQGKISNQGTLNLSAGYQFDTTTSGTATYSFAATENTTGSGVDTSHTVGLGVGKQLGASDQVNLSATATLFDTGGDTFTSYALLPGWERQWTPALKTSVAIGPEVTEGHWGPAGNIILGYKVQQLMLSLALAQGTSLVVGGTKPESASTVRGVIAYQASRAIQLSAFGYIQRTTPFDDLGSSDPTWNYAAGVTASYQIATWATMFLRYQYSLEEGGIGSTGRIPDNQVILGLTFSSPFVF